MSVNEPDYFGRRFCRVIRILFRDHIFLVQNPVCFQLHGMSAYCTALPIPPILTFHDDLERISAFRGLVQLPIASDC